MSKQKTNLVSISRHKQYTLALRDYCTDLPKKKKKEKKKRCTIQHGLYILHYGIHFSCIKQFSKHSRLHFQCYPNQIDSMTSAGYKGHSCNSIHSISCVLLFFNTPPFTILDPLTHPASAPHSRIPLIETVNNKRGQWDVGLPQYTSLSLYETIELG